MPPPEAAAAAAAAAAPPEPPQSNGDAAPTSSTLPELNRALSAASTTIFSVMSALAAQHQSVNLGQGFPDDEGPAAMKDAAAAALREHSNQYPPMPGVPELRAAVARHSARFTGVPLDGAGEVLVTAGATEGIAAAFMGVLNPGDEVCAFFLFVCIGGLVCVLVVILCVCAVVLGAALAAHAHRKLGRRTAKPNNKRTPRPCFVACVCVLCSVLGATRGRRTTKQITNNPPSLFCVCAFA
jgi:hypothetical protein